MMMCLKRAFARTAALALGLLWCPWLLAQDTDQARDDALDSLLQKLEKPAQGTHPPDKSGPIKKDSATARKPADAAKTHDAAKTKNEAKPKAATGQTPKPGGRPKNGSGDLSSQDKDLDSLLEKLGDAKDEPAAPERGARSRPDEQAGPSERSAGGGGTAKQKPKDQGLQGKDKEIDDRLEEFAGKKKKRKSGAEAEGSGPLGEIIKEMRDVEQRLGKPETGEDTQSRQKQIVKRIETLIQQMKQSGSSGSIAMRQQGQRPGNQPGQNPGANAGGAPATKPATPSQRHALPGGKDVWGHLPAELREEMYNIFKEDALPAKFDLIRRYYLSVAKQRLIRGD
jgi:hypothetical protein